MCPLYEYRCIDCGWIFEDILKPEDSNDPQFCPQCEGPSEKMKSVIAEMKINWKNWDK